MPKEKKTKKLETALRARLALSTKIGPKLGVDLE